MRGARTIAGDRDAGGAGAPCDVTACCAGGGFAGGGGMTRSGLSGALDLSVVRLMCWRLLKPVMPGQERRRHGDDAPYAESHASDSKEPQGEVLRLYENRRDTQQDANPETDAVGPSGGDTFWLGDIDRTNSCRDFNMA